MNDNNDSDGSIASQQPLSRALRALLAREFRAVRDGLDVAFIAKHGVHDVEIVRAIGGDGVDLLRRFYTGKKYFDLGLSVRSREVLIVSPYELRVVLVGADVSVAEHIAGAVGRLVPIAEAERCYAGRIAAERAGASTSSPWNY